MRQRVQVPQRHAGLTAECVAALSIGVVADVRGVVAVEKAERPVVEGQPQDRHVVGVHHAVAKTHRLPLREQIGRATGDFLQHRRIGQGRLAALGIVMVDHEIGQPTQALGPVGLRKVLEVTEADEAWCHAGDHRSRLQRFAQHRQWRAGDGQRARGRDAQAVHGFGTQKFADRRAQHRAAIAHARIRRQAGALELQFLHPRRRVDLAQPQRAAVAQLSGPHAELVSAVDAGQRLHARPQGVAAEHLQRVPVAALGPVGGQPEHLRAGLAAGHPMGFGHGSRQKLGVVVLAQRMETVGPVPLGSGVQGLRRGRGGVVGH